MIAERHHIGAGIDEAVIDVLGDAEAMRRILAVDDDEIGSGAFAQLRQDARHCITAGAAGYATVTDSQGLVTRYDVDAAGRLVKITAPTVTGTTPSTQFAYSATGDLTSLTDGEGRTVTFQYDANGNQILQRDHAGNTVTRRRFDHCDGLFGNICGLYMSVSIENWI